MSEPLQIFLSYTLPTAGALLLLGIGIACARYYGRRQQRLLQEAEERSARNLGRTLESQEQYFRLLAQKEWLLKEVHHRVKNNLQLVISLLNMQTAHLRDEPARSAFNEMSNRIYAISLAHQQPYQDDNNMTLIDMREYIGALIRFLEENHNLRGRIRFDLDIADMRLEVAQCVPVGLILNEAITNAIRHGFPSIIAVTLRERPGNNVRLIVSDNGIGMPRPSPASQPSSPASQPSSSASQPPTPADAATNPATPGTPSISSASRATPSTSSIPSTSGTPSTGTPSTMGLPLIHTLTTQLEGYLTVASPPGVTITVDFRRESQSPKSRFFM